MIAWVASNYLKYIVYTATTSILNEASDDRRKKALDAQKELEKFNFHEARKELFKAIFYNSVAVLRLARTSGDKELEKTALDVYENVVLKPLNKASAIVRKQFINTLESYVEEKK